MVSYFSQDGSRLRLFALVFPVLPVLCTGRREICTFGIVECREHLVRKNFESQFFSIFAKINEIRVLV